MADIRLVSASYSSYFMLKVIWLAPISNAFLYLRSIQQHVFAWARA